MSSSTLSPRSASRTWSDTPSRRVHAGHDDRVRPDQLVEHAKRFGRERRNRRRTATILPDVTQVGWGVGCGAYPVITSANISVLRISADGTTRFALSGHEMGQGIRTMIAAVLLRALDIDPANYVQIDVPQLGPGQEAQALKELRDSGYALSGLEYPKFTTFSYIAHFVEVRVEPRTRRIRVPRVVSIADCGRVISPRTSESQVRGGVVWAIGSALREETEVDPRFGGWLNNDLADYVVPVNADIGDIEVGFIDRPDPLVNSLGSKGVGEVAMVGAARGRRQRDLSRDGQANASHADPYRASALTGGGACRRQRRSATHRRRHGCQEAALAQPPPSTR